MVGFSTIVSATPAAVSLSEKIPYTTLPLPESEAYSAPPHTAPP